MQRESTRALVLKPSGGKSGAHAPPGIRTVKITLDKAFDLIEGHPSLVQLQTFTDLDRASLPLRHSHDACGSVQRNGIGSGWRSASEEDGAGVGVSPITYHTVEGLGMMVGEK